MRYKDFEAPRDWGFWLLLIALVMLLPLCWLPQLSSSEAIIALVSRNMTETGDYISYRLLGQEVFAFPVMPWLLSLLTRFFPLNEFSVRLLGILPIFLLAALCYLVTKRVYGKNAAPVAAVVSSTVAVLVFRKKGIEGDGYTLYAFLINAAWFAFYYIGRIKRKWLWAWSVSHLILCLAVLTVGFKALFFFYFPLFWIRRPATLRRRMLTWEHGISIFTSLILMTIWLIMNPELGRNLASFLPSLGTTAMHQNYVLRLFTFPIIAICGTFPWLFLAWPAFCQAYRPLEQDPNFSSYNRTIISSLFVFFWLMPTRGPSELLPLIGPFAILVASNYEVLVRRHGPELLRIVRLLSILTLILSAAWVIGGMFQPASRSDFKILPEHIQMAAVIMACGSIILASFFLKLKPRFPVWMMILVSILMLKLLWTGTYVPNNFKDVNFRRELVVKLEPSIPEKATLYEVLPNKKDRNFPSEWYYLNRRVLILHQGEKLPQAKEVFVIGGPDEPTVGREREWVPLTGKVPYRDGQIFRIWKGIRNEKNFAWRAADLKPAEGNASFLWVDSWPSAKGKNFEQSQPARRPRWHSRGLYGNPTVRFEGGQCLESDGTELLKSLELEHTFLVVAKLREWDPKQVLLDYRSISGRDTVLQRIEYDSRTRRLSSLSRDGEGRTVLLSGKADVTRSAVIIVRRNKKRIDLFCNGRRIDSQAHKLKEIRGENMKITLGAQGSGDTPINFVYGYIPEVQIYNRWLDDERIKTRTKYLKSTYFKNLL